MLLKECNEVEQYVQEVSFQNHNFWKTLKITCYEIMIQLNFTLIKISISFSKLSYLKFSFAWLCNLSSFLLKQCKKLVLHYGPLILVNGEKFLENTDVCSAIHACKTNQVELNTASMEEPSLVESM